MKYEIKGGNLPVVICTLEAGEKMNTQGGGMTWMSPNMNMETEGGGGLGKALGRAISGERIFRNIYTAEGGSGMIAFASTVPGTIVAVEVTPDKPIIVQKGAYLAATQGIETEVFFRKQVGTGLFGGEGFIMQKVKGNGTVFLEIDGSAIDYDLQAGEKLVIDTGNLACMEATCSMDIVQVKGVKNVLFGGEGLFNTVVSGPGKVTVQSISLSEFGAKIAPFVASHIPNK